MRLLLKIRSQEQGVIPRLIASDDDLKRLAVLSDRKNPVLRGWRFEIFGRDAVALREAVDSGDPEEKLAELALLLDKLTD